MVGRVPAAQIVDGTGHCGRSAGSHVAAPGHGIVSKLKRVRGAEHMAPDAGAQTPVVAPGALGHHAHGSF